MKPAKELENEELLNEFSDWSLAVAKENPRWLELRAELRSRLPHRELKETSSDRPWQGFGDFLTPCEPKKKRQVKDSVTPCDPRCKAVTAKIFEAYKHFNKINPGWGDVCGKQLKNFLAAHPDWNEEKIFECIRNRFKSEVNPAQEPLSWINKLGDYAAGPLDKFGNPKTNGNGFHNGQQSHTNGSGAAGHLLDHLPSPEEIAERRRADDKRLEERRNARGM